MYLANEVYFLCEYCFICMATDDTARDRIQKKGPIPERNRSKWLLLLRAGTLQISCSSMYSVANYNGLSPEFHVNLHS